MKSETAVGSSVAAGAYRIRLVRAGKTKSDAEASAWKIIAAVPEDEFGEADSLYGEAVKVTSDWNRYAAESARSAYILDLGNAFANGSGSH